FGLFQNRLVDLHMLLEQRYPDTYTSRATAISGGIAVGYSTNTFAAPRAVLWKGDEAIQCGGGFLTSMANDISGNLIVGYAADDSFRDTSLVRAAAWNSNGEFLADLQPPDF